MSVILASQSPRRQELLKRLIPAFQSLPATIDETVMPDVKPIEYVLEMAIKKAEKVAQAHPDDLVIGCDTIVAINDEILGKPASAAAAFDMLKKLSGQTHEVHTAVALITKDQQKTAIVSSKVVFYDLTAAEINSYLATQEYADKAGAYGIQGQGALLIKEIHGDFYAIMGLPLANLARLLINFKEFL
jgi:septum formation protein